MHKVWTLVILESTFVIWLRLIERECLVMFHRSNGDEMEGYLVSFMTGLRFGHKVVPK